MTSVSPLGPRQLRPQQEQLLVEIDRAIAEGCRRIMVQAPTGFGKTIVGSTIARRIQSVRKRLIFTVPALSLIDQTVEKFWTAASGDTARGPGHN
jgi:superfamily II DNA or RNA helicase